MDSLTNFAPIFSIAALLAIGGIVLVFLNACIVRVLRQHRGRT
jgi:hypothetical protein